MATDFEMAILESMHQLDAKTERLHDHDKEEVHEVKEVATNVQSHIAAGKVIELTIAVALAFGSIAGVYIAHDRRLLSLEKDIQRFVGVEKDVLMTLGKYDAVHDNLEEYIRKNKKESDKELSEIKRDLDEAISFNSQTHRNMKSKIRQLENK